LNQYYDWHCDSWEKVYESNGPDNGKMRKLSMTCQLTDGSEYEGGELEFDFRNYDPYMRDESKHIRSVPEILPKGSIVVFPSHLWHRVKPVTKGTRYSLVVWHLGYPFK
jgi:PKHD-type hydroxylase